MISSFSNLMIRATELGKNSYCTFEFRDRSVSERLAAWLKEGHTQIKGQWELETEVLGSTEGTYRVAAAKTRGGQMYRIG
jgi:hypothetical protein